MEKFQIIHFPKTKVAPAQFVHMEISTAIHQHKSAMNVKLEVKPSIAALEMHYKGPGSPFARH